MPLKFGASRPRVESYMWFWHAAFHRTAGCLAPELRPSLSFRAPIWAMVFGVFSIGPLDGLEQKSLRK